MIMPRLMRRVACLSIVLVLNLVVWDLCLAAGAAEKPDSLNAQMPGEAIPAADSSASRRSAGDPTATSPTTAGPTTTDTSALKIAPPAGEASMIRLYDSDLPDSEEGANSTAPIYRKWWFWSVIGGALVTAMIIGAGGEEEAGPDLPGFPGPPER